MHTNLHLVKFGAEVKPRGLSHLRAISNKQTTERKCPRGLLVWCRDCLPKSGKPTTWLTWLTREPGPAFKRRLANCGGGTLLVFMMGLSPNACCRPPEEDWPTTRSRRSEILRIPGFPVFPSPHRARTPRAPEAAPPTRFPQTPAGKTRAAAGAGAPLREAAPGSRSGTPLREAAPRALPAAAGRRRGGGRASPEAGHPEARGPAAPSPDGRGWTGRRRLRSQVGGCGGGAAVRGRGPLLRTSRPSSVPCPPSWAAAAPPSGEQVTSLPRSFSGRGGGARGPPTSSRLAGAGEARPVRSRRSRGWTAILSSARLPGGIPGAGLLLLPARSVRRFQLADSARLPATPGVSFHQLLVLGRRPPSQFRTRR